MNKRMLKMAIAATLSMGSYISYNPAISFAQDFADTVVYGNIYTSNSKQDVAQALAIKDGKYVYVGDRAGVTSFIDKNTNIINHSEGMVMAGATEAHGHYVTESLEKLFMPTHAYTFEELLSETKAYVEQNPDKEIYVGAGWNVTNGIAPDTNIDFAKGLDEICADKPIILVDSSHHAAIVNSMAMKMVFPKKDISLIASDKQREDTASLEGGIILRLPDGTANGYVGDQASMYMVNELMRDAVTDEEYQYAIKDMQNTLHSQGYTNYNDGYINFYGDKIFAQLIKNDANGELKVSLRPNFVLFTYELKDDASIKQALDRIDGYYQQTSKHILPAGIKIFVDGATEAGTGVIDTPYVGKPDNYGNLVTPQEKLYKLTKAANEKGISIHTHAFGNVAVNYTINAFIDAQNEVNNGTRNTIAHARNIFDADYKRMADNNIAVAENINWRIPMTPEVKKFDVEQYGIPDHLQDGAFPIRSFVKNNVIVASSTDAPAANGYPTDVFNIVEMAVNPRAINWYDGLNKVEQDLFIALGFTPDKVDTLEITNADECVPVKDALDIMTINGAKYMGIDADRGSIEVGKYADFIIVDKNVLFCPMNEIHTANIGEVYFEGRLVYLDKAVAGEIDKDFIRGNLKYEAINNATLTENLVASCDLGETNRLNGNKVLELNFNKGISLAGAEHKGAVVAEGYTLKMLGEDGAGGKISNFKDAAVENNGTLEIKNITFEENQKDIINNGTLNLTGTNEVSDITGKGVMNVNAGTTTVYDTLEQEEVNVAKEGEVTLSGLGGSDVDYENLETAKNKVTGKLTNNGTFNLENTYLTVNEFEGKEVNVGENSLLYIINLKSDVDVIADNIIDEVFKTNTVETQITVKENPKDKGNPINIATSFDKALMKLETEGVGYQFKGDGKLVVPEGFLDGETVFDKNGVHKARSANNDVVDSLSTAASFARVEMNDIRKRMGDVRQVKDTNGMWARNENGKLEGSGVDAKFHKYQMGTDKAVSDKWRVGGAVSYTNGSSHYSRGSNSNKTYSGAAYGMYTGKKGEFVDVIARAGLDKTKLNFTAGGVPQQGNLDRMAFSLSSEVGKTYELKNNFYVEPQAELTYTYSGSDDFSSNGVKYDLGSANSLVGRLGFTLGYKKAQGGVYTRLGVLREFSGDKELRVTSGGYTRRYTNEGKDNWGEWAVGGQIQTSKATYIYADAEKTFGANVNEKYRVNVGLRYSF